MKTKYLKFVFYLMVSLEAFFVCILGIASGVFYLMFTKSCIQIKREIIETCFSGTKIFVFATLIAAAFFIAVMIGVFICIICHNIKTNKTKYEATVTSRNGQPESSTVTLHVRGNP